MRTQEEKKSVDVKRFLAVMKKYTDLTELPPEILHEFVDRIIVHAPDKSSGRRLQEIEIIYNHIREFDRSKVLSGDEEKGTWISGFLFL